MRRSASNRTVMPNTHRRRDSTVKLSRIGSVNTAVVTRDPVYNFLCCWAVEVSDKWRHNDVIVEKVINIDHNSLTQTAVESVWAVSKLSTESVGSRRKLVAITVFTPPTPTRRNSTVESRRRCVLSIRGRDASRWLSVRCRSLAFLAAAAVISYTDEKRYAVIIPSLEIPVYRGM